MGGRNNQPKKKGPHSNPSRLDQFGSDWSDQNEHLKNTEQNSNNQNKS